jgi:hypothetical protein
MLSGHEDGQHATQRRACKKEDLRGAGSVSVLDCVFVDQTLVTSTFATAPKPLQAA